MTNKSRTIWEKFAREESEGFTGWGGIINYRAEDRLMKLKRPEETYQEFFIRTKFGKKYRKELDLLGLWEHSYYTTDRMWDVRHVLVNSTDIGKLTNLERYVYGWIFCLVATLYDDVLGFDHPTTNLYRYFAEKLLKPIFLPAEIWKEFTKEWRVLGDENNKEFANTFIFKQMSKLDTANYFMFSKPYKTTHMILHEILFGGTFAKLQSKIRTDRRIQLRDF